MESISKAEKKIDVLSERVGASEDGSLWIKQALDPFCDEPRRPVGFPDLITGNSVIQTIKLSKTFSTGATASDVHIFMDTVDTELIMQENLLYNPGGGFYAGAITGSATGGVGTHLRGGVVVRQGAVGSTLTMDKQVSQLALPQQYTENGSTRVLAKAFEVHNTTNKLNVGGAVTVYRDTGSIPYGMKEAKTLYNINTAAVNVTHAGALLTQVAEDLATVTRIPGSQQWEAKDGCYCVMTMAAQTNNPVEENFGVFVDSDSSNAAGSVYANVSANGTNPPSLNQSNQEALVSPFFLGGAYFTGLPANSELTINAIWYLERFVNAKNADLVVLAQPSPFYDATALELYSKTCMRLPHGVKVNQNADGDWIKNVADVLSTFGVPGMPLVKGAVDLYNGFMSPKGLPKNNTKAERERLNAIEVKLANMDRGKVVGSPSKPLVQNNRIREQARPQRQRQLNFPMNGRPNMPPLPPLPPGARQGNQKKRLRRPVNVNNPDITNKSKQRK